MRFRNRTEAGRVVARQLEHEALREPVVLALPRGGVPVAFEVANALQAPLEVFVARKIGAPGQPELGIGAIAEGSTTPVAGPAAEILGVAPTEFDRLAEAARAELERRVAHYRGDRPLPALEGRDVILVDDGLATGVTAEAALVALRRHRPAQVILAAPVCAPDTADRLSALADKVVCVHAPAEFRAVGMFYDDFDQTTDAEVLDLLDRARRSAVD
jgi:putative phosphoribosyl transferase